jgi:hypothetical protein
MAFLKIVLSFQAFFYLFHQKIIKQKLFSKYFRLLCIELDYFFKRIYLYKKFKNLKKVNDSKQSQLKKDSKFRTNLYNT